MDNRTKKKPNVLFVYLNGHQKRYFSALANALADEYSVFKVDYSTKGLWDAFHTTHIPATLEVTTEETEELIRFLLIKSQYRDFDPVRKLLHKRAYLEKQACAALKFFNDYIIVHDIDLVCVWNGTLIPLAAVALAAKKLGRKTLFFENGYLPNTTTVDPCGVNNRNSLVGKTRAFYDAVNVEPERLKVLYQTPQAVRALKNRWYQSIIRKKPLGQPEAITLPDRYIFVPFQVHDDTQVLLHSPYLKRMEQLVDIVVTAVAEYNRTAGDHLAVIFKEHPSDFGRVDYGAVKEKYSKDGVHFLRYYPTPQLIQSAAGIITINSSVGMESLLKHKPVITLGNAFYNVEGLVCNVSNLQNLANSLSFISQEPDHGLIDKFLYYLRYEYLTQGSWRNPDENHFAAVKQKIHLIFTLDNLP